MEYIVGFVVDVRNAWVIGSQRSATQKVFSALSIVAALNPFTRITPMTQSKRFRFYDNHIVHDSISYMSEVCDDIFSLRMTGISPMIQISCFSSNQIGQLYIFKRTNKFTFSVNRNAYNPHFSPMILMILVSL